MPGYEEDPLRLQWLMGGHLCSVACFNRDFLFSFLFHCAVLEHKVEGDTVTFSFEMRSGREHNTPDKAMWGFSCTVRAQVCLANAASDRASIWSLDFRGEGREELMMNRWKEGRKVFTVVCAPPPAN